jgi:putative transcriptional regulator
MKKKRKKETVFDGIMAGAKEALAYAKGEADASKFRVHIPEDIDVKAIRKTTGLTQEAFALRYGFNLARLRDLEQKRTHPDSVVRAYLLVIQNNPKAVREALAA